MSYDHMTVSGALTKYGGEYATEAWEAELPEELRWFKADLAKAMYGIKFINADRKSCFVYRENHPFVLGWIGYGNYRQTTDDACYVVSTRLIENKRYSEYASGDHYHMRFSTNRDNITRIAKKYLRPYSPSEMSAVFTRDAARKIAQEKSKSEDACRKLYETVFDLPNKYVYKDDSSTLLNELKHLLDTGHSFVNKEFGNTLREYFKSRNEIRVEQSRHPKLDFIHVCTRFGEECVVHTPGFEWLNASNHKMFSDDSLPVCSTMQEWSEANTELAGKLAVLSMVEHEHFVEDVGFRVNEDMFYVYR